MKILHVAEALHPKWGGIAEGVFQQSVELQKRGINVEVLSCEIDDVPRFAEQNIPHHRFHPVGLKWRKNPETSQWLDKNIKRFDAVILNGLWMHPIFAAGQAARKHAVPYWIMTHGMLDPWFLRTLTGRLKKRIYWTLFEKHNFAGCKAILFTTEAEQQLARSNYPLQNIRSQVVGYGIQDPKTGPVPPGRPEELLFMSRIHPKKGLEMLFEAMGSIPEIRVKIAGTGDPAYESQLKTLAQHLGDRVTWLGFTSGSQKQQAFEDCGAMILPSHQENFGVVVVESLALHKPVLITDKVNIWNEVINDNAGLVSKDTTSSIITMLRSWLDLTPDDRLRMAENARQSFEKRFTISAHVDQLLSALESKK